MSCEVTQIVLIHGQWLTPLSWEHFRRYYEDRGCPVLAPAWPRVEGVVENVRRATPLLAGLGIAEIVSYYEKIVQSLDEPPVLMGHSLGGLIVQILLDRGLGSAGVAVGSVPPKGVWRLPFSTLRAMAGVLRNPWNDGRAIELSFEQFRYAFANSMSENEARTAYERYAIPGPGRTIFQTALANFHPRSACRVNYANSCRSSLLLIAGGEDRLTPASLVKGNFRKYRYSAALTEYEEFARRSHWMIAQNGWEEIAERALFWTQTQVRRARIRDWARPLSNKS